MSERSILEIRAGELAAGRFETLLRNGSGEKIDWVRAEALLDGLRHLQERPFDLILADLFLPDGQGAAVVRNLRQHAPSTPIIVMCHAGKREEALEAVRTGAHDFFCYDDFDEARLKKSVASAMASRSPQSDKKSAAERRKNARFPCRLAISYQTLEHPFVAGQATSETVDIGSKGLLFATQEPFQQGQRLQVSLDWPVRLENQVPLKLVAEGRVVRSANGQTAMTIEKYEFRTRRTPAREPEPAAAPRPATLLTNQKTGADRRP